MLLISINKETKQKKALLKLPKRTATSINKSSMATNYGCTAQLGLPPVASLLLFTASDDHGPPRAPSVTGP